MNGKVTTHSNWTFEAKYARCGRHALACGIREDGIFAALHHLFPGHAAMKTKREAT